MILFNFVVDCLFFFILKKWEWSFETWASRETILVWMVKQGLNDIIIKEKFSKSAAKNYDTQETYQTQRQ